jgi:large subunit ribosomal protein L35
MPKMKTHKGTKRRFKITGGGKVMRMKGLRSHNRRKKAPRTLRQFDRMLEVNKADVKRIKAKLPYGS